MTTATLHRPPTAAPPVDVRGRALTTDECRSRLAEHSEGLLGYLSGRGRRWVVVAYAISGDAIVCRIPEYNEIAQYAPGQQVTLEVIGLTGGNAVERVEVTGHASRTRASGTVLGQLPDEQWPEDLSNVVVRVPLQTVTGRSTRLRGPHDVLLITPRSPDACSNGPVGSHL